MKFIIRIYLGMNVPVLPAAESSEWLQHQLTSLLAVMTEKPSGTAIMHEELRLVYDREFPNDIEALVFGSHARAQCIEHVGPYMKGQVEMTIKRAPLNNPEEMDSIRVSTPLF